MSGELPIDKSQKLSPCPFCGGEPRVKTYPIDRNGLRGCVEVSCENALCLMTNVIAEENSVEAAAAAWNARAVHSATREADYPVSISEALADWLLEFLDKQLVAIAIANRTEVYRAASERRRDLADRIKKAKANVG